MYLVYPPPNFCITFDYNFFFVWQSSQEKSKTMVMQNLSFCFCFFLGGGGAQGKVYKVHYCLYENGDLD